MRSKLKIERVFFTVGSHTDKSPPSEGFIVGRPPAPHACRSSSSSSSSPCSSSPSSGAAASHHRRHLQGQHGSHLQHLPALSRAISSAPWWPFEISRGPYSSCSGKVSKRRPQRSFLIMAPPKGDEKILSFGDVVLRRSDLGILRGPHYINDRIIEFFFCDIATATSLDDILLIPPSISFWIANCPDSSDSLGDAVRPLKLQEKNIVLLTVNDNDDVTVAEGGHHWSLLAYDRRRNVFVHHDSLRGVNSPHGEKLYRRLRGFLGGELGSSAGYVEGFTPRQENGYDCGLFVMAIARLIAQWHVQRGELGEQWIPLVAEKVSASSVGQMREQILSRIEHLMEQQEG